LVAGTYLFLTSFTAVSKLQLLRPSLFYFHLSVKNTAVYNLYFINARSSYMFADFHFVLQCFDPLHQVEVSGTNSRGQGEHCPTLEKFNSMIYLQNYKILTSFRYVGGVENYIWPPLHLKLIALL